MISKKDILLIGDTPGWAFDNIIDFVRKNLGSKYDFYYDFTIYNPRAKPITQSDSKDILVDQNLIKHYKRSYVIYNIPILKNIAYKCIKNLNKWGIVARDAEGKKRRIRKDNTYDCVVYLDFYMNIDGDFDSIVTQKTVKGIYTDGFPPKGIIINEISLESFNDQFLKNADSLLVGSNSISKIYKNVYPGNIFVANLAYDEQIFKPKAFIKNSDGFNYPLVIGWTGNPNRSFKGYFEIIEPAINELIIEGYKIELKSQFKGSLNSLADFWNKTDLAVIASEADAGPSMFMEASLCGIPTISTRIGMPNEIIHNGINGFFIKRDKEELKKKIIEIYNNPMILSKMSMEIRKDYIPNLGKEKQKQNWLNLFQNILNEEKRE